MELSQASDLLSGQQVQHSSRIKFNEEFLRI